MNENGRSQTRKQIVDPQHLLQAITNSIEHSSQTVHGVTGVAFKPYTITVRKKPGLCWVVECKFKKRETDVNDMHESAVKSRCRRSSRKRS